MTPVPEPEPAPTDTSWIQMEPVGARQSGWVRRAADQGAAHVCLPPMEKNWPAGTVGDLWCCRCGQLWRHVGHVLFDGVPVERHEWRPAPWWLCLRYAWAIVEQESIKPPRPPCGPSGVSPGPDGAR